MRISSISNSYIITREKNLKEVKATQNKTEQKQTSLSNFYYADTISFCKKKKKTKNTQYKARLAELKRRDINTIFAKRIASLPDSQYKRALDLLNKKVNAECVEELTMLEKEEYKQAQILADRGIYDFHLHSIASLDKTKFAKAIDLMNKGLDSDCVTLFVNLSDDEFKEAEKLLREGQPPFVAGHLCKLSKAERDIAQTFVNANADVEIACEIARYDEEKRKKCLDLLNDGINSEFIIEIANLTIEQEKRIPELKKLKVGDSCLGEFAALGEEDYLKAIEMLKSSVYEDYIGYILDEENGRSTNKEYRKFREKGYSKTSSYALSLLTEEELAGLNKVKDKNPILKELFKDEYEISVVCLQNEDCCEVICTKQMRTPNGSKITLVRTFDEYKVETTTRTEEYPNNSTASLMTGRSGTFRTKYDKFGEIREYTEFIQDNETNSVIGVIHSKLSPLLTGVYESTYYDISQFKTTTDTEVIDEEIENCVTGDGETISKVVKNNDGSVTYTESIEINDNLIDRLYSEKRNEKGEIISSTYEYKIQKEDSKEPLMHISRSFIREDENNTTNTINGITYKIHFDNEKKIITISDGKNKKEINAREKLPYYSADILWNVAKGLQADTLITIFDNVNQWKYCADEDSISSTIERNISTGTNSGIIYHEAGHIIANNNSDLFEDEEIAQTYGTEMESFKISIPYNEQEYIQYFSPRAGLMDSYGIDEFIAETNLLLSTYGSTDKRTKTRTQFLAKYFPNTIAKIAQTIDKNSRESILK